MVALLIGLGIPVGLIIGYNFLNNKILKQSEIEKLTSIPILANIPHSEDENIFNIIDDPKSGLSNSFRSIRTNIQYLASQKEKKSLLVTSNSTGEGKTFIGCNLAIIMAMSNKKTIIIDLDFRRPKVHKNFKQPNTTGMTNFLIGKVNYDEIIYKPQVDNLDVIFAGPIPPNPSELLLLDKFHEFLKKMQSLYDVVLLDTPPVGIINDAFELMSYVDIIFYVVRYNHTKTDSFTVINSIVEKGKFSNLHILFNDIDIRSSYGYKYGYGYKYYDNNNEKKKINIFKKMKRKNV
jgi:capsular exopolysaccharide synthesis family protein